MPYLSPPSLTQAEQRAVLQAVAAHPRDQAIISHGSRDGATRLRDRRPERGRRLRPERPAEGPGPHPGRDRQGRQGGDLLLPTRLLPKLRAVWRLKKGRSESLEPDAPLFCSQSRRRLSVTRV